MSIATTRAPDDRGITIVFTSLLLIPLLALAALAVDLGGWYAQAAELQRVADASALAGVTYLPEGETRATTEAIRVANKNGFENGVDGVSIAVDPVGSNRLKVTISIAAAGQFLSGALRGDVPISRSSTAEFVQPVPLGSPRNYLGTGDLLTGAARENLWVAYSGPCASKEQGERITTISDANWTDTDNPPSGGNDFGGCTPGSPGYVTSNAEFQEDGYFYAIEVPVGYSGSLGVQVYDAPYCAETTTVRGAPSDRSGGFNTRIRVRDKDSLNPLETSVLYDSGNLGSDQMGQGICRTDQTGSIGNSNGFPFGGNCSNANRWGRCWQTVHTFAAPAPGIYYIQFDPPNSGGSLQGTNNFGLRLRTNSNFVACSADATSTAPPFSATCPRVYGVKHLGLFARIAGASGATPSFYLAEIGPEHQGKTLQIDLWDSGEGAQRIEILNPLLQPVSFDWVVLCQDGSLPVANTCAGTHAPTGGQFGPFLNRTSIDVSGGNHFQPGNHRLSDSRYNDRALRIIVKLPDDFSTAFPGGETWWRIRYTVGSSPTDRTTWSATVLGDPVRLVE